LKLDQVFFLFLTLFCFTSWSRCSAMLLPEVPEYARGIIPQCLSARKDDSQPSSGLASCFLQVPGQKHFPDDMTLHPPGMCTTFHYWVFFMISLKFFSHLCHENLSRDFLILLIILSPVFRRWL
jgi:hypothetical protein